MSMPRRGRRRFSAHVSTRFLPGAICGAVGSVELLNWTSTWRTDCTQQVFGGDKLCYYVDDDPGNDAEPWQEIERVALERWMTSPYTTEHYESADVVIVPSALAHCRSHSGWKLYPFWQAAMVDGRTDVHDAYWKALAATYGGTDAPQSSAPLLVIHYDGTWQMEYGRAMLSTLARQPEAFVRRVVLCSIESALQLKQFAQLFRSPLTSPIFVTLPFSILAAATVDASRERTARPISVLFSGRPHSAFDRSRAAVYEQLKTAGAQCVQGSDTRVTCALCADGGRRCMDDALASLGRKPHDDAALSLGALKVLGMASHATFCAEPTSDTLVRSHFYAAALMGCVPVIFDTTLPFHHRGGTRPYRTEWAWRIGSNGVPRTPKRAALVRLAGGIAVDSLINYSSFTILHEVAPLMRGERENLVNELHRLATTQQERPRLWQYQKALAAFAPLLRYDKGPAASKGDGGGNAADEMCPQTSPVPCDAFSMLVLYLRALAMKLNLVGHGRGQLGHGGSMGGRESL